MTDKEKRDKLRDEAAREYSGYGNNAQDDKLEGLAMIAYDQFIGFKAGWDKAMEAQSKLLFERDQRIDELKEKALEFDTKYNRLRKLNKSDLVNNSWKKECDRLKATQEKLVEAFRVLKDMVHEQKMDRLDWSTWNFKMRTVINNSLAQATKGEKEIK